LKLKAHYPETSQRYFRTMQHCNSNSTSASVGCHEELVYFRHEATVFETQDEDNEQIANYAAVRNAKAV
jgi:hypothetical protein